MSDSERNAWIVAILAIYCCVMAVAKIMCNDKLLEILQQCANEHEFVICKRVEGGCECG